MTEHRSPLEAPNANWSSAWAQLTGYFQQARDDGSPIVAADVLAYMTELRREALRPIREWMESRMEPEAGS